MSIRVAIEDTMPTLTVSEKRAATVLLARYPMVGLESITGFAKAAEVSTATIQRLVVKLGCASYPEFRQRLRSELADRDNNPLTLFRDDVSERPLAAFRDSLVGALTKTLDSIVPSEIAAVVDLLADRRRRVYIAAGTFTYPLAEHLDFHLRKMRPGTTLLPQDTPRRADALLDIRKGDILVVFDVRRYQPDTLLTAELAAERGATIVLLTDPWMSDIARIATHVFRCHVEATTPWDTLVAMAAVVELIAASVDRQTWPTLKERLEKLDSLRHATFVPDWHQ
ncbi:MAG: MurR/RpiR family transcriptional regulator [Pseudomonadota bacterium]